MNTKFNSYERYLKGGLSMNTNKRLYWLAMEDDLYVGQIIKARMPKNIANGNGMNEVARHLPGFFVTDEAGISTWTDILNGEYYGNHPRYGEELSSTSAYAVELVDDADILDITYHPEHGDLNQYYVLGDLKILYKRDF